MLHKHARMWLASYVVHVRGLHWRLAADWLYGHLLDGDFVSNHCSWQWVAGTGSHKSWLFDAANVARCAPGVSDSTQALPPGATLEQLRARFHVRGRDGRLLSGAQAFLALWAELPGWRWLALAGHLPGAGWTMERSYRLYLHFRPRSQRWASRVDRHGRDGAA